VLLPAARRVGTTGKVTGIDIFANMLERTRQTAIRERLSNVELFKMDGGQLLFPKRSFDVVTCGFGVFFLPVAGLDEMYRVCKPGGTIGLTVFDKTVVQNESLGQVLWQLSKEYGIEVKYSMPLPASYTLEEVSSLIASHGLKKIETVQDSKETVSANLEDY
jgi:ubiquinone/menaquinone biosynthesis C-methylase UbiE